jgi:hypothetical protein
VQPIVGAGFPESLARVLTDAYLDIKRGDLFVNSGDLSQLINRGQPSGRGYCISSQEIKHFT